MSDPNLPTHVRLEDDTHIFDLQLRDGANGFREGSTSPSTLSVTGGGGKYGDFDANFSHLEQRSWHGGRGNENFVDDQTRFFDSKELWSLTPNKLIPAPQWDFAKGLRNVDEYMPVTRNLTWIPLVGANLYQTIAYSASASYSADRAQIFVRRKGKPRGSLTVQQCPDGTGKPGTANKTVSLTTTDITDTISSLQVFDWTTTTAQVSGTTYYLQVYDTVADTIGNCWEIGVDTGTSGGLSSSDGITYSASGWKMFFRVTDAPIGRKFLDFDLEGGKYAVSQNLDLSASVVYINGDRGTASAGSTTTLTNSARAWTTNQWAGARVKIIGGTGLGLNSAITSNNGTVLTLTDTLPYALDNTSRYVIYKTPWWTTTSIGTTGLGYVTSVSVVNNIAYFAQGASVNIRRAQSSANTHNWADDGTNRAEIVKAHFDPAVGSQMWKANKSPTTYSYATAVAWGVNLTFGTAVPVGSADYLVTNLQPYNNQMYITKEDSLWAAQQSRVAQVNIGINGLPWSRNGQATAVQGSFLYFNFWRSMERMLGSTVDDVGPQHDAGLPPGRSGVISAINSLLVWLFVSVDAGSAGYSSTLIFQDRTYHELFREPNVGNVVRNVFPQALDDSLPYLWINSAGELRYQEYSLDPLHESGFRFQHEAVLVSSTFDMGHTETYKFFEELSADTENLNKGGINIGVDFQSGSEINSSTWHPLSGFFVSPKDSTRILEGQTTKLRFRLRLNTNVAITPPVLNGTVLKGFEVVPAKRVWNLSVSASSILSGANHVDPDVLYRWLRDAKNKAIRVKMTTVFPDLKTSDAIYVKVEPPTVTREFINRQAKWVGSYYLVLREV